MAASTFSRVEIRTRDKADLMRAAEHLKHLADEIQTIAGRHDEETAIILANHSIRETSQMLRNPK